jgi:hypothetical protein
VHFLVRIFCERWGIHIRNFESLGLKGFTRRVRPALGRRVLVLFWENIFNKNGGEIIGFGARFRNFVALVVGDGGFGFGQRSFRFYLLYVCPFYWLGSFLSALIPPR